jgi:transcriptional regulator with XRE-family HTH domain
MNKDVKNILAFNVKKLREAKSMKREELALALGFDNSYISKIEKAKMNITINRLINIADFFEIKFTELFANWTDSSD